MSNRVGQNLGNYQLVRLLGQGGFAEVYLGEHLYLKRYAALKILKAQLTSGDLQDFLREAQAIASLKHPNIINVLDFGMDSIEQVPYLVMDYAPNGTLRQIHPKGSILPLSTVVTYIKQVAAALDYAHEKKLIHCDVKPENMLLDDQNNLLLSDFGIAATTHSATSLKTQEYIGTVHYSAPEQIQGKPRTASDQYALAAVVYEWLTGKVLFDGTQFIAIAMQHLTAAPDPLRARNPALSSEVEHVVLTALSKEPEKRFKNTLAFATALEQASQAKTLAIGERLLTYPSGAITVAWSPDSTRVVSVHPSQINSSVYRGILQRATLHVWDAQTGRQTFVCNCPRYSGYTIMYSPDGTHIVAPDDHGVTIWNAFDGSFIGLAEEKEHYMGSEVAWSPDGKYLASVNCVGLLSVRDAMTTRDVLNRGELGGTIDDPDDNVALAWSPDGQFIAYASGFAGFGSVDIIKVAQLKDFTEFKPANPLSHFAKTHQLGSAHHLAWSPDGKFLAGTFDARISVCIWDIRSNNLFFSINDRLFRGASWSPDSAKIALTVYNGEVVVYNVLTETKIFTYKNHKREMASSRGGIASWSPDGTRIASMDGSSVQIWRAP